MKLFLGSVFLIVFLTTLSVEGRVTKRKYLRSSHFEVQAKEPAENKRLARQSTNCIITQRSGRSTDGQPKRERTGRYKFAPPPPEGSPTCIIISAPTSPTTTTSPPFYPGEPPPFTPSPGR